MDRSFLSRPEVVAASREFVCVRLATYEDRDEASFLKTQARTRSGDLENTVFTVLSPDGKKQLVRGSRGTRQLYADAKEMAGDLSRIARRFTPKAGTESLPLVANVRLAVDIAAADNQPLVVLV